MGRLIDLVEDTDLPFCKVCKVLWHWDALQSVIITGLCPQCGANIDDVANIIPFPGPRK